MFFKHCESEFNISFQVLSNLKKRLKKIGSGHDHLKKRPEKKRCIFAKKFLPSKAVKLVAKMRVQTILPLDPK